MQGASFGPTVPTAPEASKRLPRFAVHVSSAVLLLELLLEVEVAGEEVVRRKLD